MSIRGHIIQPLPSNIQITCRSQCNSRNSFIFTQQISIATDPDKILVVIVVLFSFFPQKGVRTQTQERQNLGKPPTIWHSSRLGVNETNLDW